jgi:hypothetical protein
MYHINVTVLIHFHFHIHFIVSCSSTCFGHQASIFRRHYTSTFWCEGRELEMLAGCKLWVDWFIGLGVPGVCPVDW